MRFTSITMNGFLSYATETRVELEDITLCSVTGINGSGKSSLFQVIPWVLFGSARIGKDKDTVVNDASPEASASVELYGNDGVLWKFTRTRVRQGSSSLKAEWFDFDENVWVRYSDHRIDSAQQTIYDIINITELAFNSLSYVKNSAGTEFINADSNTRRSILMSLLPSLDIWQNLQYSFAARLSEAKAAIRSNEALFEHLEEEQSGLQDSVDETERQVKAMTSIANIAKSIADAEKRVEGIRSAISSSQDGRGDIEAQLRAMEAERKAFNSTLDAKISEASSLKRERSSTDRLIEQSQRKLEAISDKISDTESIVKTLDKDEKSSTTENDIALSESDIVALESKLLDVQNAISTKKSKLEEIDERIAVLETQEDHDTGKCMVCESELSHVQVKKMIKALLKDEAALKTEIEDELSVSLESVQDRISRAQRRIAKLKKERADIAIERTDSKKLLDRLLTESEELSGSIAELTKELQDIPSLEILEKTISDATEKYVKESSEEGELREQLSSLNKTHPLTGELNDAIAALGGYRSELSNREKLQSQLVVRKESLSSNRKRLEEITDGVKSSRDDIANLEWLSSACNPKGIPSILIADILGDLQRRQNEMLSRLYGSNTIEVEYRQTKENKSNDGSKDVLDIIVHMPGGAERPVESCSSGELIRVTLTNLLSMIQVFNERNSGSVIENLFLDEALGVVDKEVIPILIDALRDAISENIIKSAVIIAHDDQVINSLPQNIHVTRSIDTDLSSTVEITL